MCKGNSIAILNCPFILCLYVFSRSRTESDQTAYGIRSGGVRNLIRRRTESASFTNANDD